MGPSLPFPPTSLRPRATLRLKEPGHPPDGSPWPHGQPLAHLRLPGTSHRAWANGASTVNLGARYRWVDSPVRPSSLRLICNHPVPLAPDWPAARSLVACVFPYT